MPHVSRLEKHRFFDCLLIGSEMSLDVIPGFIAGLENPEVAFAEDIRLEGNQLFH